MLALLAVVFNFICLLYWAVVNLHYAFREVGWVRARSGSRVLVVFLHGVKQKRFIFAGYVHAMSRHVPDACDIYAPFLRHDHNGSTARYAAEALAEIERWYAARGPDARVLLVGNSNGGRVAAHIESRTPPERRMRVLTVAAPLRGTALLDILPAQLIDWHIGRVLRLEMRAGLAVFPGADPARYRHIAAQHDGMVFPVPVTHFPENEVFVVWGHSHFSLMVCRHVRAAVAEEAARLVCDGHARCEHEGDAAVVLAGAVPAQERGAGRDAAPAQPAPGEREADGADAVDVDADGARPVHAKPLRERARRRRK